MNGYRIASPYTARQCPVCGLWIYVADGPFAEGDPTKTLADSLHWEQEHPTVADLGGGVGRPFMHYNDETVAAR